MIEYPLVSVLITSYNREKYIAEAIGSVLSQSYPNFELIIIDDCSIDNTFSIAKHFQDNRIKLFRNSKNLGQFKNRNLAIDYANGEYIKFLDSDDVLLPDALLRFTEAMMLNEDIMLCVPFRKNSFINNLDVMTSREALMKYYLSMGLQLDAGPTGVMFKRCAINELRFESHYGINADVMFNLKMACGGLVVALSNNYAFWRKHPEQIDTQQKDRIKMIIERNKINVDFLNYQLNPMTSSEKVRIRKNLLKINLSNFFGFIIELNFVDAMKTLKIFKSCVYG